ncbi:MAG: hypothetical protein JSR82_14025 [Verrucomicrobia bacterium]|nr:hypothetical protein [Verrucomicrobiota bacterium]
MVPEELLQVEKCLNERVGLLVEIVQRCDSGYTLVAQGPTEQLDELANHARLLLAGASAWHTFHDAELGKLYCYFEILPTAECR